MKTAKQKSPVNTEEKNGNKRIIFFLILSFILVLGSVGVAVLLPYIETLPVYATKTLSFDTSLIDTSTTLDSENKLSFTLEENYTITFSSDDSHVYAGTTETKYVFSDKGGASSNVSMKFTYTNGDVRFVKFKLFVCNEAGTVITEVEDKNKISYEKDENEFLTMTYLNNSNIFVEHLVVSFQLRVKN